MIRVAELALREIRLTLREPFRISSGVMSERRILLLELRDSDGNLAWSECVAFQNPIYSAETIDTAWLAITSWLAPRVLGIEFGSPSQVKPALDDDLRGHNMAKAAVEMGIWGLSALRAGKPLAETLGGTRDRVVTGISLGIQATPDALVTRAKDALAAGYRKIKVKIMPGKDVEYVAAVREALGPDVSIMADANSAYTLAQADHLAKLDAFNLIMIEQPLGEDDLVRHAALQRRLATPLCLDESITSLERAQDMLTLGSGKIINIKPGRVGGFAAARAIHDLGVPVWCGGMLESGIGRAYNVALASLPNFTLPGDLSPSARYWDRDIVTPEWTMDAEGMVKVPSESPGIGVTVDVDRVENLTARRQVLTAAR
ncbi:MAG TPA: o-succinylbenzoate synthase [Gemmatimonadaceae bacterium]|jgi:O-succinylbenzoate synthase|nr:o-succinylbenzoate synthase [Gemmatimonadaceae bacterium]